MRWATRSVLAAVLLIGIGVILLLRNADVWPEDLRVWPLALIAIGLWLLVERIAGPWRPTGGLAAPFALLGIGTVALLEDLDVFSKSVSVWPVVVIAIGLAVLIDALTWRQRRRRRHAGTAY